MIFENVVFVLDSDLFRKFISKVSVIGKSSKNVLML